MPCVCRSKRVYIGTEEAGNVPDRRAGQCRTVNTDTLTVTGPMIHDQSVYESSLTADAQINARFSICCPVFH